jgi:hypothetical protein
MRGAGILRRLRASWRGPEPPAFGERSTAAATGRMLGRSQPDAPCELVLLDQALVLVVPARRGQAQLYLYFEELAYFEPDVRSSDEYAYEVWDHGVPDGPRSLAFVIKKNRRGSAFVALLEEAVRAQRGLPTMIVSLEAIFPSTFVMPEPRRRETAGPGRPPVSDGPVGGAAERGAAARLQPDPGAHPSHLRAGLDARLPVPPARTPPDPGPRPAPGPGRPELPRS